MNIRFKRPRFALLMLAASLIPGALHAAGKQAVLPGEYLTEGGWGTLTVNPRQGFAIEVVGANAHTCSLGGEIRGMKAEVDTGEGSKKCIIDFAVTGGGIQVTPRAGEECRAFCGMRAWFDGLYLKPAEGCGDAPRAVARKQFKSLYDKKDYQAAHAKLEPLLRNCAKTLHWSEEGRIRNDLAITQFHLKDFSGCLLTLQPLAEDAAMTAEQLADRYPPVEADIKKGMVQATRTNLKLCKTRLAEKSK